jgi:uncharacterized protein (TIGR02757 family)
LKHAPVIPDPDLKDFLDSKVNQFNRTDFIENDPVSIPHRFSKKQDIEIAGLFAAILAWGQRKTIIQKGNELLRLMDNEPYDFVRNGTAKDFRQLLHFKHRTFQPQDAVYFAGALNRYYTRHHSLEQAFPVYPESADTKNAIENFHRVFFAGTHPQRVEKHIPNPARKSACKRINMYLRWMVRNDQCGVDFGIWKGISPSQLICPCDVHVERVARKLHLVTRKVLDWQTAVELTGNLKRLDPLDPVKYDFALFGLGIADEF